MPRSGTRSCARWVTSRFSIPRTSLRGCQHGGLERRLEHPSSEARPLRGGPSPFGAEPAEVPGHSPSPYSPECVEEEFSEVHSIKPPRSAPPRPATLRIVPEERIGRIGAPLATIEARQCYRPLRLATVQLPRGFLFLRPRTLMHERRGQTGSKT